MLSKLQYILIMLCIFYVFMDSSADKIMAFSAFNFLSVLVHMIIKDIERNEKITESEIIVFVSSFVLFMYSLIKSGL